MSKIKKFIYLDSIIVSYLKVDDLISDVNNNFHLNESLLKTYLHFISCVSLLSFDLKNIIDEITFKINSLGRIKEISCIGDNEINLIPYIEINENKKKNFIKGIASMESWQDKMKKYNSYFELKNEKIEKIFNHYFSKSVQKKAFIFFYQDKNNSEYAFKFEHISQTNTKYYYEIKRNVINNKNYSYENNILFDIINFDDKSSNHLKFINEKDICFKCTCSKEKFIQIIKTLEENKTNNILNEFDDFIEVNCQKCGKKYQIKREELL